MFAMQKKAVGSLKSHLNSRGKKFIAAEMVLSDFYNETSFLMLLVESDSGAIIFFRVVLSKLGAVDLDWTD